MSGNQQGKLKDGYQQDGQQDVPNLLIIGGRFEADNAALFDYIKERAGDRIALITAASHYPREIGEGILAAGAAFGLQVEPLSLSPENPDSAYDADDIARLRDIGHVYFSGGDQNRIMAALMADGEYTPMAQAIRDIAAAGGLIAGSSAGAAIMSNPMIADGDPVDAILHGVGENGGVQIRPGLGFLSASLVDQHFLARGRAGRLMAGLKGHPDILGIGVDENTGIAISGQFAQVLGESRVSLMRWIDSNETDDHYEIDVLQHGSAIDLAHYRQTAALPVGGNVNEVFMPIDPFNGEDQVKLFSQAKQLAGDTLRMIWDDVDGLSEIRLRLTWLGQRDRQFSDAAAHRYALNDGAIRSDVFHLSIRHIS